ncbi:MAG TPA: hypothetical protein VFF52_20785 [Isosphaeraceae bacterium]|nr:hypothetical protein [Isosphaeraceae bacterium]
MERVSRHYERGVERVHIGAYVRSWLHWAGSGLEEMGTTLAEFALDSACRLCGRVT